MKHWRVEMAAGHGLRAEPVALAQHDGEIGNVDRLAAVTNMRETWRTSAVVSASRADHEARRVAERDDRQVEGVAELDEARRLVGGVGVDRAAEVVRVVRDQAERPALDADERGDDSEPEVRAQLERPNPSSASVSITARIL